MTRRSLRLAVALVAPLVLGLTTACATLSSFDNEAKFEDAWKSYVRAMRWKNFSAAAQFVDEDSRSAFLDEVSALEAIRMTDHEYGQPDFDEEVTTADVTMVYRGYNEATLVETRFVEQQHWQRNPESGEWTVEPDLSGFKGIASAVQAAPAQP